MRWHVPCLSIPKMHLWSPTPQHQHESWLALVAETAGVAGCGIARVEVTLAAGLARGERVVVQVRDGRGAVLGAAALGAGECAGDASEPLSLARGEALSIDVGYSSLLPEPPLSVVVWIERDDGLTEAASLDAPEDSVSVPLEARVRVTLGTSPFALFAA